MKRQGGEGLFGIPGLYHRIQAGLRERTRRGSTTSGRPETPLPGNVIPINKDQREQSPASTKSIFTMTGAELAARYSIPKPEDPMPQPGGMPLPDDVQKIIKENRLFLQIISEPENCGDAKPQQSNLRRETGK